MSSYDPIQSVLDFNLSEIADIPDTVFENVRPIEQPYSSEFVWTQFIPVGRLPSSRGPDPLMRYNGLYIVNVCTPQNTGTKRSREIVELILGVFKGANHVSHGGFNVTIESSRQEQGFDLENHFCVPVNIDWYCYAT